MFYILKNIENRGIITIFSGIFMLEKTSANFYIICKGY